MSSYKEDTIKVNRIILKVVESRCNTILIGGEETIQDTKYQLYTEYFTLILPERTVSEPDCGTLTISLTLKNQDTFPTFMSFNLSDLSLSVYSDQLSHVGVY